MFHGENVSKYLALFFFVTSLLLSFLLYKEQERKEVLAFMLQDAHNADNYNQSLYLSSLKSLYCIMKSASEEERNILKQLIDVHISNAQNKIDADHTPQEVKDSFKNAIELIPVECKNETEHI